VVEQAPMQRMIDDITRLELQRIHPLVRSWLPGSRIEANVRMAVDSSLGGERAGDEAGHLVEVPETSGAAALIVRCTPVWLPAGTPGPSHLIDLQHPAMDAPDPASLIGLL